MSDGGLPLLEARSREQRSGFQLSTAHAELFSGCGGKQDAQTTQTRQNASQPTVHQCPPGVIAFSDRVLL
ncbi:hypothetical protein BN873_890081 [Candidatus Competibacter denitrificans Run_A_D11]|uniref:Uncharacterized protein n=1 Tax=Candidatus Competibacter denitrificans Run_A_D11 TaxID=1400863 RepID=W6MCN1_9GAMM|nr:hypothetical protein BN873_890081 [Candidatus Competibacter denitrificans Run_A_D11]